MCRCSDVLIHCKYVLLTSVVVLVVGNIYIVCTDKWILCLDNENLERTNVFCPFLTIHLWKKKTA